MGKKVVVTLGNLLKQRKLSLKKLSELTDIRRAALSELSRGKRENINFIHIEKIAEVLNISDIREIITILDTEEVADE